METKYEYQGWENGKKVCTRIRATKPEAEAMLGNHEREYIHAVVKVNDKKHIVMLERRCN